MSGFTEPSFERLATSVEFLNTLGSLGCCLPIPRIEPNMSLATQTALQRSNGQLKYLLFTRKGQPQENRCGRCQTPCFSSKFWLFHGNAYGLKPMNKMLSLPPNHNPFIGELPQEPITPCLSHGDNGWGCIDDDPSGPGAQGFPKFWHRHRVFPIVKQRFYMMLPEKKSNEPQLNAELNHPLEGLSAG